jgi:hypothetical protein
MKLLSMQDNSYTRQKPDLGNHMENFTCMETEFSNYSLEISNEHIVTYVGRVKH